MCAIAGWLSQERVAPGHGVLAEMSRLLVHRGPDDAGTYTDDAHGIVLAHRRLSIIDLSSDSHQPMPDVLRDSYLRLMASSTISGNFTRNSRGASTYFATRRHRSRPSHVSGMGRSMPQPLCRNVCNGHLGPTFGTLHLARNAMGMKPLYCMPLPGRAGPGGVRIRAQGVPRRSRLQARPGRFCANAVPGVRLRV
jgi:hypothetical protein